jgi:hypothetical protein
VVAIAAILPTASSRAGIWVPQHQPTIAAGLAAAVAGDTVFVTCGTYTESGLVMKSGVRLQAASWGCVTIQPFAGDGMLCNGVDDQTAIEGITFVGSFQVPQTLSVGVRCVNADVLLHHCRYEGWERAGVFATGGAPRITWSEFEGNGTTSNPGGGLYALDSSPTVSWTTFTRDIASSGAGAWFGGTTVALLRGTDFYETHATDLGAGIYTSGSSLTMNFACTFDSCGTGANVTDRGGALYVAGGTVSLSESCNVSANAAARGAGIYLESGTVLLDNCSLSRNRASVEGGAFYAEAGNAQITNCTFSRNTSFMDGGALHVSSGTATITGGMMSDNGAAVAGGAIEVAGGSVSLSGTLLLGNGATDGGGAVHVTNASASLTSCTVTEVNAFGPGPNACGVYADNATITLQQTILRNSCTLPDLIAVGGSTIDISCCNVDEGRFTNSSSTINLLGGNVQDTPAFCSPRRCSGHPLSYDYSVAANSVCLPGNNTCGMLIGVFGQGCAATAVDAESWGRIKARYR